MADIDRPEQLEQLRPPKEAEKEELDRPKEPVRVAMFKMKELYRKVNGVYPDWVFAWTLRSYSTFRGRMRHEFAAKRCEDEKRRKHGRNRTERVVDPDVRSFMAQNSHVSYDVRQILDAYEPKKHAEALRSIICTIVSTLGEHARAVHETKEREGGKVRVSGFDFNTNFIGDIKKIMAESGAFIAAVRGEVDEKSIITYRMCITLLEE